jgi:hypothetical protein
VLEGLPCQVGLAERDEVHAEDKLGIPSIGLDDRLEHLVDGLHVDIGLEEKLANLDGLGRFLAVPGDERPQAFGSRRRVADQERIDHVDCMGCLRSIEFTLLCNAQ